MKYRKIAAVILSTVLVSGLFSACGGQANEGSTASSSASAEDLSTQGSSSSKAYLSAALEIIREAGEICDAGGAAAKQLKQAADDLYNLTEDETYTAVTDITNEADFITYSFGQIDNVAADREKLADLQE